VISRAESEAAEQAAPTPSSLMIVLAFPNEAATLVTAAAVFGLQACRDVE